MNKLNWEIRIWFVSICLRCWKFIQLFFSFCHFSSICLLCTLAVATAPPPQSGPSAMPRKFRDSKISRIQPYIHRDALTAPAIDSHNNLHNEDFDSTIKYYHTNKFPDKNHGHKKFGFEKKKVSSNHELFKWVVILFSF